MIHWFSEAELERDPVLLGLSEKEQIRFERALMEAQENIPQFPEIGRINRFSPYRQDIRELMIGQYRRGYLIHQRDEIWIPGFVPPESNQALD